MEAKNQYYDFDVCPAFWEWIDCEHAAESLFSVQAVDDELQGHQDALSEWGRDRPDLFLPPDEATIASFPALTDWTEQADYDAAAVSGFLRGC